MRRKLFSEEKLNVAKFFLDKLCEVRADKEFICYLDGFLTAAVSVLDVLLEDGNVIFSLGIPLEEKLYPEVGRLIRINFTIRKIKLKGLIFPRYCWNFTLFLY